MDVWIGYSYSLYFSDQFSCIKFFPLTYGLKDIDFQSFNDFLEYPSNSQLGSRVTITWKAYWDSRVIFNSEGLMG